MRLRSASGRTALGGALGAALLAGCGLAGASPGASPGAPSVAVPSATSAAATGSLAPPATSAPGTADPGQPIPQGGRWRAVQVGGSTPAAREDHTWTVDPASGVAWLFGGRGGGTDYGDLWSFELATETWRRVEASGAGPAARFGHEAVWVPGTGLVITLGQAGSTFFNDVWAFDPSTATWRELPATGAEPVPRYGSCAGLGPDGRLWISHGFTEEGSRFFDTRAYDLAASTWVDATPADRQPVERCLHTCWWTATGELVLYGGQTNGVAALGDLWRLTPPSGGEAGQWTKLSDPEAADRLLPAVARRGDLAVVFGGRDIDRQALADTWLFPDRGDAVAIELAVEGTGPAARSGAAMIHDEARDRMLLFGGLGGDVLEDLWELTLN